MLIWRVCRQQCLRRGQTAASTFLGIFVAESTPLAWLRATSPFVGANQLHTATSRDSVPQGQLSLSRLPVVAASRKKGNNKGKREFHGTPPAEYKSGPGTAKWKYVNIQSKAVPKPAKGSKLPRFYVATETVRDAHIGAVFQLSESETKHALRVLRMKEGAWLEVCDGKGLLVEAQLRGLTFSNTAFATATSNVQHVNWEGPRWEIVAALGGLRAGRAEMLVEKVSELGAWSLRPLLTNRSRTIGKFEEKDTVKIVSVEELSDISEFEDENDFVNTGRIGRWERVAIAAGKQSLSAFVATQGAPPLQRVLAENMERVLQLEPGPSGKPLPCMLLVGPEGDFTEEEMQELLAAGAKPVGLGPNRLRVETAAIAMVAGAVLQSDSLTFETGEQKEEPIAA